MMEFFDCNCYFGRPSKPGDSPKICASVNDLLAELNRAGVGRAIVWNIAQLDASPQYGNALLADAIRNHPNLFGAWTILPPQTGELPHDKLIAAMKANHIVALNVFPAANRYFLEAVTMGTVLDDMTSRHIPLIYSIKHNLPGLGERGAWAALYDLLDDFPDLTVIITDHGSWGSDRYFRPLLETYPRVFVDTAIYFQDSGIEDLVARYGPSRLLFGTGLPERFPGGMMLAIRHAEIPEDAKTAIASVNLDRIIKEVRL